MKLSEIARALGCRVMGDADPDISGVAGIEHAEADQLTFLANPKYAPRVKQTRAAAVLVAEPVDAPAISVISKNPYLDFSRALALFYQPPRPAPGIHPSAAIDSTAIIGEN